MKEIEAAVKTGISYGETDKIWEIFATGETGVRSNQDLTSVNKEIGK